MSFGENRENIVTAYVSKSFATLDDAKAQVDIKRWNVCVNRLYYACFYIVYALVIKKLDVRTKTHSGIKSLFNNHFVRQGLVDQKYGYFYTVIMEKRGETDYGDFSVTTEDEVNVLLPQAEEFINTIKKLIV